MGSRVTILVEMYVLRESNKSSGIRPCNECNYPAVWELKEQLAATPKLAWACSEHIDTLLFDMHYGRIGLPKTDKSFPEVAGD